MQNPDTAGAGLLAVGFWRRYRGDILDKVEFPCQKNEPEAGQQVKLVNNLPETSTK